MDSPGQLFVRLQERYPRLVWMCAIGAAEGTPRRNTARVGSLEVAPPPRPEQKPHPECTEPSARAASEIDSPSRHVAPGIDPVRVRRMLSLEPHKRGVQRLEFAAFDP